jgi:hypothetical protein
VNFFWSTKKQCTDKAGYIFGNKKLRGEGLGPQERFHLFLLRVITGQENILSTKRAARGFCSTRHFFPSFADKKFLSPEIAKEKKHTSSFSNPISLPRFSEAIV